MNERMKLRTMILLAGWALLLLTQPVANTLAQGEPEQPRESAESAELNDLRFGIVEAFWRPDDANELGVGWDRILFYWNEIQPTGPDDWNTLHVLEEWLRDARDGDRVVMGLLKNTPPWATDAEPFSGAPRGLYLPIDDPDNLWAGYVGKVVDYYAPLGVHHWIVWNEPEIEAGVYGHEFSGATRDYYQLLKVAYQVAKARDPEAVIHLAGWSYWHDTDWLDKFLKVATADPEGAANGYFFDTITLHIYFRVETVEELVEKTRAIQKRYGLDKPVWINETNASPNLDPLWPVVRPNFQVDLEQQAWYIVQAHALGFGAGSASIGVYKLLDILLPEGGESFGILRPDGSRRPAFYAYRTTIHYLNGFTFPVGRQQERDFYAFAFQRPEGVTRILWARNSSDLILRVPALADEGLLVSALGQGHPIEAVDGYYHIRLSGARCTPACDIGGPPVFLVEKTNGGVDVEAIERINPQTAVLATATPTPSGGMAISPAEQATFEAELATQVAWTLTPTATQIPSETPVPASTATMTPTSTATSTPPTPATIAIAENPDEATPIHDDSWAASRSSGPYLSWLFIGVALVLSLALVVLVARRRGNS